MTLDTPFPFTALHGQPLLQTALLLATVDPLIGGVLVEGPRGTAKSTAARALAALLPGRRFVNLPLSASEEQLVGSLDLEAALQGGEVRFRPGLLARAHEGVLYVDEVNLLADGLVDLLLDVSASGVNHIERDGISHAHPARLTLVGTMNPEEGELRPQLLDRFGLFVRLDNVLPPAERQAIVRARLAFDADPAAFAARHAPAQQALAARIAAACAALPQIEFSDADHERVAAMCHAAAVEGVRADLVMLRAARAHAALAGRDAIDAADIDAVAELVLAHRRHAEAEAEQAPHTPPPPPSGASGQQQRTAQAPADSTAPEDGDWGALPPQLVPIAGVKSVRPLHAKKP
ncbi:ATP-binding protein [Azoarcus taiwanensis]|uniref:AAA domain-containing protein n=1 Tax=Azoarcus taiwanensis TaxID=666964 RepID=A0A972JAQ6_9RHOO|nr:ATP-binding protein [Azoarcus taiwanensis]NMG04240.1 AAA domain-containing protein [Azoarcus taiwanensis]